MTRNNAVLVVTRCFCRPLLPALAVVVGLALSPVPAAAVGPSAAVNDLAACQRLAESAPAEALNQAKAWAGRGGGSEAELCRAVALFHSGDFTAAAKAFEALATASSATGSERQQANLYNRAAWSWLRAGDYGRAERLYTTALERQPGDADLLLDRGLARAEAQRYPEAIDDFTATLRAAPQRAEVYHYRAMAYLSLNQLKNANADVDQVLRLTPDDSEALVLRGTVRALSGDIEGARQDWRTVIKREPQSPSGKGAAANLKKLEQELSKGKKP